MKRILLILLLLPLSLFAQVGTKNFIDQNYIDVTGNADMEVAPDMIYLTITLSERDSRNKVSIADQELQMRSKLKGMGVNVDTELQVRDLSSTYKAHLLQKSSILLEKEYQLLVHDGKMAGRVLLEMERLGISNITLERIDHSQMDKLRRQVKVEAVKAARQKAADLAAAVDQEIGRALFIHEYEVRGRMNYGNITIRGISATAEARADAADIDFEKIRIEASVQCYFELK